MLESHKVLQYGLSAETANVIGRRHPLFLLPFLHDLRRPPSIGCDDRSGPAMSLPPTRSSPSITLLKLRS